MSTNTRPYTLLVSACLLLLSTSTAAVELIDAEAQFLSAAPIVSTETFERDVDFLKIREPTVTIDDVVYEISSGRAADCFKSTFRHCWSIERQKGANQLSSGANFAIGMADWNMGAGDWDIIHFGDRRRVKAFGFYIQAAVDFVLDDFPGWEILVHEDDGTVTSFTVATKSAKKRPVYFGFISEAGISKIDVGSKPGRAAFNWDYMLVSRSQILKTVHVDGPSDPTAEQFPAKSVVDVIDNDDIEQRGALFYEVGSRTPATGTVIARYENGGTLAELHVRAGVRHGPDIYWHANGQMKSRGRYVDGRRHGLFEYWHENGQASALIEYSYGRKVGPVTWWHANGQKKQERFFREGRKEGEERSWYANGQLQNQANFVNGGFEGTFTQWHPEGEKKTEASFENGRQHGPMARWHENGQLKSEATFVNREYEGVATSWYSNGQKNLEQTFQNGKRVGLQKQWYEDGSVKAEISFANDKLHGPTTWWYQDGTTEMILNFMDGQLHGRGTFWHSNGQMKSDGEFKDGKAKGRHSFWDEKGKKLRRRPRDYPSVPKVGGFR